VEEWVNFWQIVKASGYCEEEIINELDNLLNREAWIHFDKMPKIKTKKKVSKD
jgi:hypothetical protein